MTIIIKINRLLLIRVKCSSKNTKTKIIIKIVKTKINRKSNKISSNHNLLSASKHTLMTRVRRFRIIV